MTRERIEGRLRLHIANVSLAATSKKEGALREAKDALIREVERIVHDATTVAVHDAGRQRAINAAVATR